MFIKINANNINDLNNKLDNLIKRRNKIINELNNELNRNDNAASRKPKYYKIGKYAKVEKMTSDDYANIDKFPKGTKFYNEYPEEGIKLDI